ncbi:hypothetical protein [Acetobacterium wieringae]|uniref:hypothetical protein n=1 Tax=Acetobacterium wieringae TaxID=52694 RepID=UPI0026ED5692|nr:hypothetical protein [Acetobacterium wieringae]
MSKTKTSMKSIRNSWSKIYSCGYGDLQYIMKYNEPEFYNSGVYGWNCDIYVDYARDIAITTGYRGMTGKMIDNAIIEKYSNIAKKIMENTFNRPYEDIKKELDENVEAFYSELNNN